MGTQRDVAVLVGSLRKDSLNRKMAHILADLAPENLRLEIVEIRGLTSYDQDLDDAPPADWVVLRDRIRRADAVLFVTPEYNRSIPGVLKNAIDIASRPYGHSVWDAKPGAVVTVSPGPIGGFGANHHLRQILAYLNVFTLAQPEAYIGSAMNLIGPDGKLTNDSTEVFLRKLMTAFGAWVETHKRGVGGE